MYDAAEGRDSTYLPVCEAHVDDDIGNILFTQSEVGMMSKLGGGTSGYFGKIRHRGYLLLIAF